MKYEIAPWRRRDSNPRHPSGCTSFPGKPDKPLLHPSGKNNMSKSKKKPKLFDGLGFLSHKDYIFFTWNY